jgi:Fe2+ transport system protein FeoA
LGIYPGATISHCFESATGEPKAFEVLGSVIALRKEQTDLIFTSDT